MRYIGRNQEQLNPLHLIISKTKFIFIHICIFITLCLLLIVFIAPIIVYRCFVSKVAVRLFRRDLKDILSILGHNYFLGGRIVSDYHRTIVLSVNVEGRCAFEAGKGLINQKLVNATMHGNNNKLMYPELQQYCTRWAGYFFWKQETHFDIDEHVVLYQNNKSDGNLYLTENQARQIETEFLPTPLEPEKSPWKIFVIDNIQSDTNLHEIYHTVLFKFHHSLCDAFAFWKLISRTFDTQVKILVDQTAPTNVNKKIKQWLRNSFSLVSSPFRVTNQLYKLYILKSDPEAQIPWNDNEKDEAHEILLTDTSEILQTTPLSKGKISVEEIKEIARKNSVSFTTLLLTAVTGGIRQGFMQKWGPNVPKYFRTILPLPVQRHSEGLINDVCAVQLKLPIGYDAIQDRLKLTHETIFEAKNSYAAQLSYFLLHITGLIPKGLWRLLPKPGITPGLISNFPGALETTTILGQKVMGMRFNFTAPPINAGFVMGILTYAGVLEFTCSADFSLCFTQKEMDAIAAGIEQEFRHLRNFGEEIQDRETRILL